MASEGVLLTRLLTPQPPLHPVVREGLIEEISEGLRGRLVTVLAGAGYGKTTAIVQALSGAGTPWVWLSCDARLAGPGSFLAHLSAGLERRFPGFGSGLDHSGAVEAQVLALANEMLETIPDDVVLAFDDVHLLGAETWSALALMLEQLGPNVHFVVAGRSPLPLALGSLRLGGVLEVGEVRLAFDHDDAGVLLKSLGLTASRDEVRRMHARTEGWVAGLVLAAQTDGALGDDAHGHDDAYFAYLAEEVFLRQPEPVRRFLEDTSVLGRFSPEMAAAVTDVADPRSILGDLVGRHLFTVRLDPEGRWFRYHHLMRDFLRTRLRAEHPERWVALHRAAAGWWRTAGEPAEAVPHLLETGDLADVVDVLEPIAERMALGPQAPSLAGWLAVIPEDLWRDRTGILLARASLLLADAKHEASFAEMERAIERLLVLDDHDRAAGALVRLQASMLVSGTQPSVRVAAGRRWFDRISDEAAMLPAARLLLASAYGYERRFAEARKEIDAALDARTMAKEPALGEFARVVRGFYVDFWGDDPAGAADEVARARGRLASLRGGDPLSLVPFATMLDVYLQMELGEYEDAFAETDSFMADAKRIGMERSVRRATWWVRSSCRAGLGLWDAMADDPLPDLDRAEARGSSYVYRYRAPAARLAGARGDLAALRHEIRRGREEIADFGPVFDTATFLCEFALAACGADPPLAEECADEAMREAESVGSRWLRARSTLIAAACRPEADRGDQLLAQALELTGHWGLPQLWTRRERGLAPTLLARAIRRGLGPEGAAEDLLAAAGGAAVAAALREIPTEDSNARARLAELAGRVGDIDLGLVDGLLRDRDAAVREAARRSWSRLRERPRAALEIRSFGELTVSRDGAAIPATVFVRQKARALLARLICASGPVHREILCEDLWPDLAPERASAALRTTLHDLRRAVEPELGASSDASMILADGENIRLQLGPEDRLDLDDLMGLARRADGPAGLADLRTAAQLYRAPLLEEWPYEPWAERRREEVEGVVDDLLERLARACLEAGAAAEAVVHGRRLVRRQPQRESWHRLLMRAFADDGDRAMALRQFHACRAVLRREQGVEPGAETRALYDEFLRDQDR